MRVSLSKTPYRGNRKAYVFLEKAMALKLLKGAHIKIGWVSCRVHRKKEVNRCFRCLGFGHIAADIYIYNIYFGKIGGNLKHFRGV